VSLRRDAGLTPDAGGVLPPENTTPMRNAP
jgi:hypothetical protein